MTDYNKHIETFINDEKKITFSPSLQSRIIAQLNTDNAPRRISFWQPLAVAASIAAVVVSGFLIGSSYHFSPKDNYVVINDSQIENFLILTDDADEQN